MKKKPFILYQIIQTGLPAPGSHTLSQMGDVVFVGVTTGKLADRAYASEHGAGELGEWLRATQHEFVEVERFVSLDEAAEAERALMLETRPRFNLAAKSRPGRKPPGRTPGAKNKAPTRNETIRVRCLPDFRERLTGVLPELSESAKVVAIVEEWFSLKQASGGMRGLR